MKRVLKCLIIQQQIFRCYFSICIFQITFGTHSWSKEAIQRFPRTSIRKDRHTTPNGKRTTLTSPYVRLAYCTPQLGRVCERDGTDWIPNEESHLWDADATSNKSRTAKKHAGEESNTEFTSLTLQIRWWILY